MEAIRDKSSPRFHLSSPLLHLMLPRFDRHDRCAIIFNQDRWWPLIGGPTWQSVALRIQRLPRWPSRVPYVFFLYFFNIDISNRKKHRNTTWSEPLWNRRNDACPVDKLEGWAQFKRIWFKGYAKQQFKKGCLNIRIIGKLEHLNLLHTFTD